MKPTDISLANLPGKQALRRGSDKVTRVVRNRSPLVVSRRKSADIDLTQEMKTGYKKTWDGLSQDFDSASYYVACISDEEEIRDNGASTAKFLRSALQITTEDRVLEIGCGVARVGHELAPHCQQWHGCDISGNMIRYARERTATLDNVYLKELPGNTLEIYEDESFDVVYSTIVFMHLDKPDVYKYMQEANRVLKPGGRVYFDTYNLLAPEAWSIFVELVDAHSGGERPRHASQFSTPQEFSKFMTEAGFVDIEVVDQNPQLVTALGKRPANN